MSDEQEGKGFELPEDLRAEVLACAVEKQISLDWLLKLYRRGYNARVGPTGEFPYGKISPTDAGELSVAMKADHANGVIQMMFGKPVAWLAFPAAHARHLAKTLIRYADELDRKKH